MNIKKTNRTFDEYPNLQYILEENQHLVKNENKWKVLQKLITIHMDIRDLEEIIVKLMKS